MNEAKTNCKVLAGEKIATMMLNSKTSFFWRGEGREEFAKGLNIEWEVVRDRN